MRPLTIALIGYGAMGRAHAMAYRDLAFHYGWPADTLRFAGVSTTRQASADAAARELGCPIATTDALALIERPDVDIVDICTPHDSHETLVTAAARAGRHIYCEKPLARTLDEARRMAAEVQRAGVKCGLTFNFRFFPCVMRAKQLIDEGFVGRVFGFYGRYYRASYIDPNRPMSWRLRKEQAGGGVLIDSGAHMLDFAQWLLGDIASVRATLNTPYRERPQTKGAVLNDVVDVEDIALLQTRLAGGAIGTLEASRMATGATNDVWFEVRGNKGALRFALEDPNWLHMYDTRAPERSRGFTRVETVARYDGALAPDWSQPVGISRTHTECQRQFLRAIWEDREPSPGIIDGLRVQALADAAYRSAEADAWAHVDAHSA
jgi:predicted dehydrogenase